MQADSAMSDSQTKIFLELSGYEFHAAPLHYFDWIAAIFQLLGAGIAVFAVAKDSSALQETAPGRVFSCGRAPEKLRVAACRRDGSVTGFTGKARSVKTSALACAAIADEFACPV